MAEAKNPRQPAKGRLDRWATLNQFAGSDLAEVTRRSGSPAAGLVWFVLFSHASGRDGLVRASSRWLAEKTGLSRNTARAALRHLLACAAVERDPSGRGWFRVRHLEKE
jgi:hypothetical protein